MQTRTQLHEIRQRRGVSAARIATLAGVSRQTIHAIEAGEYVPNTTLALQLSKVLEVRVEELFSLEDDLAAAPKPVTVDLIGTGEPARKGQGVRICQVGKKTIGVSAASQAAMLPMADGVIVESSNRTHQAEVHIFQSDPEEGKRLLMAGWDPGMSLLTRHLEPFATGDLVVAQASRRQALEWLNEGVR